jgi:hypothetical protein
MRRPGSVGDGAELEGLTALGAIPDIHDPCLWTLCWLKLIRIGARSLQDKSPFLCIQGSAMTCSYSMLSGYKSKIFLVATLSLFQPAMLNSQWTTIPSIQST